jgi:hypothetical protein
MYSRKKWAHEGKEKKHKQRDSQHDEGFGEQQHDMSTKTGTGERQWMKMVRK